MADVKLVVVGLDELRRIVQEAVQNADVLRERDEWLDANSAPFSRRTFLRLARERAFPVSRVGKKYIARRSDIERFLEGQRVSPQRIVSPEPVEEQRVDRGETDPIARALEQGRVRLLRKPR